MCLAGELKLVVRNWVNKNAATPYALSYNCMVCSSASCTVTKDLTVTTADHVAAAVVTDKFATSDLAGAGT